MDIKLIERIIPELSSELVGKRLGRVFRLSRFEYVFDLLPSSPIYLFVSIEPARPVIFLSRQRFRELDKAAKPPNPLQMAIKDALTEAEITHISSFAGERVIKIAAVPRNGELGMSLIVQLTGISANLFLTDISGTIISSARNSEHPGQKTGEVYAPPVRPTQNGDSLAIKSPSRELFPADGPLSQFLDDQYKARKRESAFAALATAARTRVKRELSKEVKLLSNLQRDLKEHGEPEKWKRFGDLLLANSATARLSDDGFIVNDYFDDAAPEILIPAKEKEGVTEAAERYFRLYSKARNGINAVSERLEVTEKNIAALKEKLERVDIAIGENDEELLRQFSGEKQKAVVKTSKKDLPSEPYARSFISSDGFEILVGKKAADNDKLTFRIAKSLDTWMHAADYPGSHVVIRNPNKKEIPQRTLQEAAQLAAFYSKGNKQIKAAVHYTQKKFVNKPKGSAPGLVSLSSFKTLFVEPRFPTTVSKK